VLQLKNTTPFEAGIALFPNEDGIDTLYVTLKATFEVGKTLTVAAKQRSIVLADEYWGEAGVSSLKYASEAHLSKPSTDVVLIGEVIAPDRRPVTQLDVTLAVADRKKVVRVFGDRVWENGLVGFRMTPPALFEKMPLVYERAFGGVHTIEPEKKEILFEPRNPVGCGFVGKRKKKEIQGMNLPNLEDPAHLISKPTDQPPPAGFGYFSPSWEPRKSFVGTYDEAWQKSRAPYLPKDFDARFFNMAHPDMVCRGYLKGGEPVEVVNASPNGLLRFNLPTYQVEAAVRVAGKIEKPPLNLETVLIEPSVATLCMTWRASLVCGKKAMKVERVELVLQGLDVYPNESGLRNDSERNASG